MTLLLLQFQWSNNNGRVKWIYLELGWMTQVAAAGGGRRRRRRAAAGGGLRANSCSRAEKVPFFMAEVKPTHEGNDVL